jgi:hypothetical protein
MDIKIEGDPGTGNTFQEINIGTVQNYNPNATTVINYNGTGGGEKEEGKDAKPKGKNPMEMRETPPIREQIMLYVSCLNTEDVVVPEWLGAKYMDLWNAILDLPEVEAEVYGFGKQRGTSFNRNLIGNIINYLATRADKKKRVYKELNASLYAYKLHDNSDHPVRLAMGKLPKDEIKNRLDKFMENYLL